MGVKSGRGLLLFVGMMAALFTTPAMSATVGYLRYGAIQGNATAAGYAGQVEVLEYSFNATQQISMDVGGVVGTVKPQIGYLKLRVLPGSALADLLKESWTYTLGQTAILSIVNDTGGKITEVASYTLSDVGVASATTGVPGVGADDGMLLYLAMSSVVVSTVNTSSGSKSGLPTSVGYDLWGGKPL